MPASAQQPVSARTKGDSPAYLTVAKWGDYFDWPPEGGLRHIIFHAETNGFAPAIKRIGRRVLIDVGQFWEIVREQGGA